MNEKPKMERQKRYHEQELKGTTYQKGEMLGSAIAREIRKEGWQPEAGLAAEKEIYALLAETKTKISSKLGIRSQKELNDLEKKLDAAAAISRNPRIIEQVRKELRERFYN